MELAKFYGVSTDYLLCLTENRNHPDTEIYADGVATAHFQNFNRLLEVLRGQVLSQYQPVEEDAALKALEAMQVQEEDDFCQVTHRTWDAILHAIWEAHKDDTDSAPDGSNVMKLIKDAKKAMAF